MTTVVQQGILIIDEQLTNLQPLRDVNMSRRTKLSEERLVERAPRRIKAVLKAKGVQPFTSKV